MSLCIRRKMSTWLWESCPSYTTWTTLLSAKRALKILYSDKRLNRPFKAHTRNSQYNLILISKESERKPQSYLWFQQKVCRHLEIINRKRSVLLWMTTHYLQLLSRSYPRMKCHRSSSKFKNWRRNVVGSKPSFNSDISSAYWAKKIARSLYWTTHSTH